MATATPATPAPTLAPTPAPAPAASRCTLDAYREEDVDRVLASVRRSMKQNLGVTDADIDDALARVLGGAGRGASATGRVFGDVTKCRAVRANRVAAMAGIGVLGGIAAATVFLLLSGGQSQATYFVLQLLNVVGTGITLFQLRHVLSLTGKIMWHGSDANTRALLALTAVGTALGVALYYTRSATAAAVPLLAGLAGVTAAKLYFTVRSVQQPSGMHLLAAVSALDRLLSNKKIVAVKRLAARRPTKRPAA